MCRSKGRERTFLKIKFGCRNEKTKKKRRVISFLQPSQTIERKMHFIVCLFVSERLLSPEIRSTHSTDSNGENGSSPFLPLPVNPITTRGGKQRTF